MVVYELLQSSRSRSLTVLALPDPSITNVTFPAGSGPFQSGETVGVNVHWSNPTGSGPMWVRLIEGGSQIASQSYPSVGPGDSGVAALSFIMPSRDVFFDAQAGTVGTVTSEVNLVVRLLVLIATTLTLSLSPSEASPGQTVSYGGTLTRNDTGAGVSNETISINTPGGTATKTTDGSGNYSGSFSAPSASGSYSIVASFGGTPSLAASSSSRGLQIGPISPIMLLLLAAGAYILLRG